MIEVFGARLDPDLLEAICAHGEREYPKEACGVVLGPEQGPALARVVPLRNVQDRYHQLDPVGFPRDAKDAFRVDELERMRVLEAAEKEGLVERVVYHSHCDAGAYFSPEDRAMAVRDGIELLPGAIHVVVSVREGKRRAMAAYRWKSAAGRFEEARVPLPGADEILPDLDARAMEGKEAARPIRPVGQRLVLRRVTRGEAERLSAAAAGRAIPLDAEARADLERFARGYYSPCPGFGLTAGGPWTSPVTLEVPAQELEGGTVVELGPGLGAIEVEGVAPVEGGRMRVAGPVFAYPDGDARDAPELRAEILRRGWKRVLLVPPGEPPRDGFDGYLAEAPLAGRETLTVYPLPKDPWRIAAAAQNLGATHVAGADTTGLEIERA